MDFDQLNTFVEVAKLGNFSRAAEKVLRSQPAVSAQIRQLEQEYGHKLFDRSAKSVRLTPGGEVGAQRHAGRDAFHWRERGHLPLCAAQGLREISPCLSQSEDQCLSQFH